jgi:hypothetical protein
MNDVKDMENKGLGTPSSSGLGGLAGLFGGGNFFTITYSYILYLHIVRRWIYTR